MRECIGVSVIALWGGSFSAPSGRISLIRELKRCEGGGSYSNIGFYNGKYFSKIFDGYYAENQ